MKLNFEDLFIDNGNQLTAKKNIRIGALVIPPGHPINPKDPQLGLPLDEWKNKEFEVDIDQNNIVIKKVS